MSIIRGLAVTKMSGAGNTFALVDAREGSVFVKAEKSFKKPRTEIAKRICDPVEGLSTDGILFIQKGSEGFDFDWDFYNSDGSTAEMCGNAARCAARFCVENLDFKKSQIRFKTGAGLITTEVLSTDQVRVNMPEVKIVNQSLDLKTHTGAVEKFFFVNTGVPHLVQKIHVLADTANLKEMAREARSHEDLKPAGSNVTFYVEKKPGFIDAVTFERGVENYTMACGTGAVAAALVHSVESGQKKISVQMPGGLLEVDFSVDAKSPRMTGPAIVVGEFNYNLEVLK